MSSLEQFDINTMPDDVVVEQTAPPQPFSLVQYAANRRRSTPNQPVAEVVAPLHERLAAECDAAEHDVLETESLVAQQCAELRSIITELRLIGFELAALPADQARTVDAMRAAADARKSAVYELIQVSQAIDSARSSLLQAQKIVAADTERPDSVTAQTAHLHQISVGLQNEKITDLSETQMLRIKADIAEQDQRHVVSKQARDDFNARDIQIRQQGAAAIGELHDGTVTLRAIRSVVGQAEQGDRR